MGRIVIPGDRYAERFRQHYAPLLERDHPRVGTPDRVRHIAPGTRWVGA
jgi:hypothetical protein